MQVGECMTANPITISPKTAYSDAFRLMNQKKIRRLPVIDKEGYLVGMVGNRKPVGASQICRIEYSK